MGWSESTHPNDPINITVTSHPHTSDISTNSPLPQPQVTSHDICIPQSIHPDLYNHHKNDTPIRYLFAPPNYTPRFSKDRSACKRLMNKYITKTDLWYRLNPSVRVGLVSLALIILVLKIRADIDGIYTMVTTFFSVFQINVGRTLPAIYYNVLANVTCGLIIALFRNLVDFNRLTVPLLFIFTTLIVCLTWGSAVNSSQYKGFIAFQGMYFLIVWRSAITDPMYVFELLSLSSIGYGIAIVVTLFPHPLTASTQLATLCYRIMTKLAKLFHLLTKAFLSDRSTKGRGVLSREDQAKYKALNQIITQLRTKRDHKYSHHHHHHTKSHDNRHSDATTQPVAPAPIPSATDIYVQPNSATRKVEVKQVNSYQLEPLNPSSDKLSKLYQFKSQSTFPNVSVSQSFIGSNIIAPPEHHNPAQSNTLRTIPLNNVSVIPAYKKSRARRQYFKRMDTFSEKKLISQQKSGTRKALEDSSEDDENNDHTDGGSDAEPAHHSFGDKKPYRKFIRGDSMLDLHTNLSEKRHRPQPTSPNSLDSNVFGESDVDAGDITQLEDDILGGDTTAGDTSGGENSDYTQASKHGNESSTKHINNTTDTHNDDTQSSYQGIFSSKLTNTPYFNGFNQIYKHNMLGDSSNLNNAEKMESQPLLGTQSNTGRSFIPPATIQSHTANPSHMYDFELQDNITLFTPFPQFYLTKCQHLIEEIQTDIVVATSLVPDLQVESQLFRILYTIFCCWFRWGHWRAMEDRRAHRKSAVPDPLYPSLGAHKEVTGAPYHPDSVTAFLSDASSALSNAKGMVAALNTLTTLSQGGILLHYLHTHYMKRDMKRVSKLFKTFIFSTQERNPDLLPLDSSYIRCIGKMTKNGGGLDVFVALYNVLSGINDLGEPVDHSEARNEAQSVHPTRSRRNSKQHNNHHDVHNDKTILTMSDGDFSQLLGHGVENTLNNNKATEKSTSILQKLKHERRNSKMRISPPQQTHAITTFNTPQQPLHPHLSTQLKSPSLHSIFNHHDGDDKELQNEPFSPHHSAKPRVDLRKMNDEYDRRVQEARALEQRALRKQKFNTLQAQHTHYVAWKKGRERGVRQMSFVPGTLASVSHAARNMWVLYAKLRSICFFGKKTRKVLHHRHGGVEIEYGYTPPIFRYSQKIFSPFNLISPGISGASHTQGSHAPLQNLNSSFLPDAVSAPFPTGVNNIPLHNEQNQTRNKHTSAPEIFRQYDVTLTDMISLSTFFFNYDRFITRVAHRLCPHITPHLFPLMSVLSMLPPSLTIADDGETIGPDIFQPSTAKFDMEVKKIKAKQAQQKQQSDLHHYSYESTLTSNYNIFHPTEHDIHLNKNTTQTTAINEQEFATKLHEKMVNHSINKKQTCKSSITTMFDMSDDDTDRKRTDRLTTTIPHPTIPATTTLPFPTILPTNSLHTTPSAIVPSSTANLSTTFDIFAAPPTGALSLPKALTSNTSTSLNLINSSLPGSPSATGPTLSFSNPPPTFLPLDTCSPSLVATSTISQELPSQRETLRPGMLQSVGHIQPFLISQDFESLFYNPVTQTHMDTGPLRFFPGPVVKLTDQLTTTSLTSHNLNNNHDNMSAGTDLSEPRPCSSSYEKNSQTSQDNSFHTLSQPPFLQSLSQQSAMAFPNTQFTVSSVSSVSSGSSLTIPPPLPITSQIPPQDISSQRLAELLPSSSSIVSCTLNLPISELYNGNNVTANLGNPGNTDQKPLPPPQPPPNMEGLSTLHIDTSPQVIPLCDVVSHQHQQRQQQQQTLQKHDSSYQHTICLSYNNNSQFSPNDLFHAIKQPETTIASQPASIAVDTRNFKDLKIGYPRITLYTLSQEPSYFKTPQFLPLSTLYFLLVPRLVADFITAIRTIFFPPDSSPITINEKISLTPANLPRSPASTSIDNSTSAPDTSPAPSLTIASSSSTQSSLAPLQSVNSLPSSSQHHPPTLLIAVIPEEGDSFSIPAQPPSPQGPQKRTVYKYKNEKKASPIPEIASNLIPTNNNSSLPPLSESNEEKAAVLQQQNSEILELTPFPSSKPHSSNKPINSFDDESHISADAVENPTEVPSFWNRVKSALYAFFVPTDSDWSYYRMVVKCIVCVTLAFLIAVIPNQYDDLKYVHWSSSIAAYLITESLSQAFIGIITRLQGTIFGGLVGYFVSILVHQLDPELKAEGVYVCAVLVSVFVFAFTFYKLRPLGNASLSSVMISTCTTIAIGAVDNKNPQLYTMNRIAMCMLGCASVLVVSLLMWPTRSYSRFLGSFIDVLKSLRSINDLNFELLALSSKFQWSQSTNVYGPSLFSALLSHPVATVKNLSVDDNIASTPQQGANTHDPHLTVYNNTDFNTFNPSDPSQLFSPTLQSPTDEPPLTFSPLDSVTPRSPPSMPIMASKTYPNPFSANSPLRSTFQKMFPDALVPLKTYQFMLQYDLCVRQKLVSIRGTITRQRAQAVEHRDEASLFGNDPTFIFSLQNIIVSSLQDLARVLSRLQEQLFLHCWVLLQLPKTTTLLHYSENSHIDNPTNSAIQNESALLDLHNNTIYDYNQTIMGGHTIYGLDNPHLTTATDTKQTTKSNISSVSSPKNEDWHNSYAGLSIFADYGKLISSLLTALIDDLTLQLHYADIATTFGLPMTIQRCDIQILPTMTYEDEYLLHEIISAVIGGDSHQITQDSVHSDHPAMRAAIERNEKKKKDKRRVQKLKYYKIFNKERVTGQKGGARIGRGTFFSCWTHNFGPCWVTEELLDQQKCSTPDSVGPVAQNQPNDIESQVTTTYPPSKKETREFLRQIETAKHEIGNLDPLIAITNNLANNPTTTPAKSFKSLSIIPALFQPTHITKHKHQQSELKLDKKDEELKIKQIFSILAKIIILYEETCKTRMGVTLEGRTAAYPTLFLQLEQAFIFTMCCIPNILLTLTVAVSVLRDRGNN